MPDDGDPLTEPEWQHEYVIKDHLGNGRAYFRAGDANNAEPCVVVLQEAHYYPFGLSIMGLSEQHEQEPANKYQYNGKELTADFGLHWSDYGARWQDPAVARWWSVDPLGERYPGISSYVYVADNPLMFIDPTGMELEEIGDEDALKQLVSHVFDKKIEARVKDGKVTLHKVGAGENDTGLDAESDKDFIGGLDAGQQIIFGVLNNVIQDSETTTVETFESSEFIAIGRWGENKQQMDVGDMLTMERKTGGGMFRRGGILPMKSKKRISNKCKEILIPQVMSNMGSREHAIMDTIWACPFKEK